MQSGVEHAAAHYGVDSVSWTTDSQLSQILGDHGAQHAVVPYLPTGWTNDALMPELRPLIDNHRAALLLADLSRETWPHAKAGFFGVKKKIEPILGTLALNGTELAGET